MKTRNIVMVVVGGILFVTAAVLIVVGVTTHSEAGLLTACETSSGRFDYDRDCSDVTWPISQFPLQVHASTTNPYPPVEPESAVRSEIGHINGRLGFTALAWTDDAASADITVALGVAQEVGTSMGDANGDASHFRRNDGSLACEVRTWNTGSAEMAHKVLTHELGHALGLAHDDFEDSAMFGGSLRRDGTRLTALRFTDYDRDLLRDLYAPPGTGGCSVGGGL